MKLQEKIKNYLKESVVIDDEYLNFDNIGKNTKFKDLFIKSVKDSKIIDKDKILKYSNIYFKFEDYLKRLKRGKLTKVEGEVEIYKDSNIKGYIIKFGMCLYFDANNKEWDDFEEEYREENRYYYRGPEEIENVWGTDTSEIVSTYGDEYLYDEIKNICKKFFRSFKLYLEDYSYDRNVSFEYLFDTEIIAK